MKSYTDRGRKTMKKGLVAALLLGLAALVMACSPPLGNQTKDAPQISAVGSGSVSISMSGATSRVVMPGGLIHHYRIHLSREGHESIDQRLDGETGRIDGIAEGGWKVSAFGLQEDDATIVAQGESSVDILPGQTVPCILTLSYASPGSVGTGSFTAKLVFPADSGITTYRWEVKTAMGADVASYEGAIIESETVLLAEIAPTGLGAGSYRFSFTAMDSGECAKYRFEDSLWIYPAAESRLEKNLSAEDLEKSPAMPGTVRVYNAYGEKWGDESKGIVITCDDEGLSWESHRFLVYSDASGSDDSLTGDDCWYKGSAFFPIGWINASLGASSFIGAQSYNQSGGYSARTALVEHKWQPAPAYPSDRSITVSDVGATGCTINWNEAEDGETASGDLEYRIVLAPAITALDELVELIEAPASRVILDWTKASALSPEAGKITKALSYPAGAESPCLCVAVRDGGDNDGQWRGYAAYTPLCPADTQAPLPGGRGIYGIALGGTQDKIEAWGCISAATDRASDQKSLQYKTVWSMTAEEIDSIEEIEALATDRVISDWNTDNGFNGRLSGITWSSDCRPYFASLVKDEKGNIGLYAPVHFDGEDRTPPVVLSPEVSAAPAPGYDAVTLSWNKAADLFKAGSELYYRVSYCDVSDYKWENTEYLKDVSSHTLSGLKPGAAYKIQVCVTDAPGPDKSRESGYAEIARLVLSAPTGLSLTLADNLKPTPTILIAETGNQDGIFQQGESFTCSLKEDAYFGQASRRYLQWYINGRLVIKAELEKDSSLPVSLIIDPYLKPGNNNVQLMISLEVVAGSWVPYASNSILVRKEY